MAGIRSCEICWARVARSCAFSKSSRLSRHFPESKRRIPRNSLGCFALSAQLGWKRSGSSKLREFVQLKSSAGADFSLSIKEHASETSVKAASSSPSILNASAVLTGYCFSRILILPEKGFNFQSRCLRCSWARRSTSQEPPRRAAA